MWGVPVDHESFKQITMVQWLWYFYNLSKDQEEKFVTQRDLLEYHAAFSEPEMVSKLRDSREGSENAKIDKDFASTIKGLFGRDINLPNQPSQPDMKINKVGDILNKISTYQSEQDTLKTKSRFNFKHWTNIDLG